MSTHEDTAQWRRVVGVVEAELAPGQAALLQLETGQYHALNEVGTHVWALLDAPRTLDQVCAVMCAEYTIEPERCAADVGTYLAQLRSARLIEPVS